MQESRVEKQQIVETFGEDFIFFFGERPRMLNIQGVLINTNDFNWKSEFWENYENHLRGTRLLEANARMYFYFDDVVVEGYMLQAQTVQGATNPYHLPLSFQIFVTNYAILSNVGSVFIPDRMDRRPLDEFIDELAGGDTAVASTSIVNDNLTKESPSSLNAFLADAASFATDATFSIQNTLENIKNTFFGRRVVTPSAGAQIIVPTISNQGQFQQAPRNRPIYEMTDEYVERSGAVPQFDNDELARVRKELALQEPKELEAEARKQLTKLGVNVDPPDTAYLLLGRAAFAGLQTFGSFGIRQATGELDV